MKKILAILLLVAMLFCFTGCEDKTDLEQVKDKGSLVVGVTDYANMNYMVDDKWSGFESDFARLFAEEIGVDIEFREIVWEDRYDELINGNIDCIWNAMTVDTKTQNHISVSNAYILNSQVLVVRTEQEKEFESGYGLKKFKFVSEAGSSGENMIFRESYTDNYTVKTQQDALEAVANGEADATIIDSILADAMVGKGKTFPNLTKSLVYSDEACAVGFRKDSDMVQKFNEFLEKIHDDELIELANKYGLTLY